MYNKFNDDIVGKEGNTMCAATRLSESERRKEIMASAAKVIIAKGLDKATMEEVIAGTTLSKGGVYHYYGSIIEIFKDLMLSGIDYRNEIIKNDLNQYKDINDEFMAKEMTNKIIDDNPYMPLYIEFLIAQKRNPELKEIMLELQEKTKERFEKIFNKELEWLKDKNIFQFITDFINAMILASNILEAREHFTKNRQILEQMFIYIFKQAKEKEDECI